MANAKIIALRKELHRFPELSGMEYKTAQRIKNFIQIHHPTKIIEQIGGTGIAAVYEYADKGKTITIRCELDALPIQEQNDFEYQSANDGVSHKCGHDGHMSIVAGLIFWLKNQTFTSGKVVLLFQPAEETGTGAAKVVLDEQFRALQTDYIFALHNIPGEKMGSIITIEKGFSAEVKSFSLEMQGVESHAAEPEHGINPAIGISELIQLLSAYNVPDPYAEDFAVLTPVHINMGQKSYGISPANGEIHYTIRTWDSKHMENLQSKIEQAFQKICDAHQLTYECSWFEHFPASMNHVGGNQYVENAALSNGFTVVKRPYPFTFGEDLGWFSEQYQTTMFGLGAGINTPSLHNPTYDFPEEIILSGIQMFASIIEQILGKN